MNEIVVLLETFRSFAWIVLGIVFTVACGLLVWDRPRAWNDPDEKRFGFDQRQAA